MQTLEAVEVRGNPWVIEFIEKGPVLANICLFKSFLELRFFV